MAHYIQKSLLCFSSKLLFPIHYHTIQTCLSLVLSGNNLIKPFINNVAAAKSLQSCPTLCDPTDGSPLGSAIPGILQARVLEWDATALATHNKIKYI